MTSNYKISLIPQKYARALFDISSEKNSHKEYLLQLEQIMQTINSSADLVNVLKAPTIPVNSKVEITDNIFRNKIDDNILNLLKVLIEKNRFEAFEQIFREFEKMANDAENKRKVEIISPINPEPEVKEKILNKLRQKLNSEIIPSWKIDKSIIAGLIFKTGDIVIDTSVKSKLKNLSNYILR